MRPRGRCREQGPAVWTGWDVLAALVPALCDWKCVCVCASLQTSIGSEMLRLKAQSASCTLSPPGPGRLALGPGEVWETRRAWLSVALSVPRSLHPRAHRKDPPPKMERSGVGLHSPAGRPPPSPAVSSRGPAGTVHSRPQVLPPAPWRGGVWPRPPRLDTGEVHVPLQAPGVLHAAEGKSRGGNGVQPAPGLRARARTSSRRAPPPHLRAEGLFSETVYLPTCHVLCQNHDSEGRVHLRCGPLGGVPASSAPLGAPQRLAPEAFAFLLCSQVLTNC